jgi:LmbE family N-acetylglucosaminyl deacetylase
MEDHMNTCRVVVTAAFVRSAPNYRVIPPRKIINDDVTIYHSMPNGLRDQLRRRVIPGLFVNTTAVQEQKCAALAEHKSQREWLDSTQKMDLYLKTMEEFALDMGKMSGKFKYAEGFRRHLHYGFCGENDDPLKDALGEDCLINEAYEKALEEGF